MNNGTGYSDTIPRCPTLRWPCTAGNARKITPPSSAASVDPRVSARPSQYALSPFSTSVAISVRLNAVSGLTNSATSAPGRYCSGCDHCTQLINPSG